MTLETDLAKGKLHAGEFLRLLGVVELPPLAGITDVGEDPATVDGHLEQSAQYMSILKLSMSHWLLPKEVQVRRKIAAAQRHHVNTTVGGAPFEIAVAQQKLEEYLNLCTDFGVSGIECADAFTVMGVRPKEIVRMARRRGLDVQFELGRKHRMTFTKEIVVELIEQGSQWLDAGASHLVVAAPLPVREVGLFDGEGRLNRLFADRFARTFELDHLMFEAPTEASQFALLDHFGREVHLSDVRFNDLLTMETYRRGLHAEAFGKRHLSPRKTQLKKKEEIHERHEQ